MHRIARRSGGDGGQVCSLMRVHCMADKVSIQQLCGGRMDRGAHQRFSSDLELAVSLPFLTKGWMVAVHVLIGN